MVNNNKLLISISIFSQNRFVIFYLCWYFVCDFNHHEKIAIQRLVYTNSCLAKLVWIIDFVTSKVFFLICFVQVVYSIYHAVKYDFTLNSVQITWKRFRSFTWMLTSTQKAYKNSLYNDTINRRRGTRVTHSLVLHWFTILISRNELKSNAQRRAFYEPLYLPSGQELVL